MRFVLRIISLFFLVIAVIAGVVDAIQSVAAGAPDFTLLGVAWFQFSPDTLNLAQAVVQRHLHPFVWDPVIQSMLLQAPGIRRIPGSLGVAADATSWPLPKREIKLSELEIVLNGLTADPDRHTRGDIEICFCSGQVQREDRHAQAGRGAARPAAIRSPPPTTHFVNGHGLEAGPYPEGTMEIADLRHGLLLGCRADLLEPARCAWVTAVRLCGRHDAEPDLPGGLSRALTGHNEVVHGRLSIPGR